MEAENLRNTWTSISWMKNTKYNLKKVIKNRRISADKVSTDNLPPDLGYFQFLASVSYTCEHLLPVGFFY